jgi:UDP-N-acetylmuramate--alanine ligase
MFFKRQPVFFIGIGGIGMSGLAAMLSDMGYPVRGSDLKKSAITDKLAAQGIVIYEGHDAANLGDAQVVVVSSAVSASNPEVMEARRRHIPVVPRGELLAELMRLKYGIAIGGSHGKTTTSSMTAQMMSHAGLDPTVVVGGRVSTLGGSNARMGQSEFLVVESDESDGSFLKLSPIVCVVTNIDAEHLDHYGTVDGVRDAFVTFLNRIPFYGLAIVCLDDANVQRVLPRVQRRVFTYGTGAQCDLRIVSMEPQGMGSVFRAQLHGKDLGEFPVRVPGAHNVRNAAAVVCVGLELEIPVEKIRAGLASFGGVDRRFQLKGEVKGVSVVDDYGHHPTEIRATLAAARGCAFQRRLVLFQPHRYTRTESLMDEFAAAFHDADQVFVLDIYAASEAPLPGITSQALVEKMSAFGHRHAQYVASLEAGARAVAAAAKTGDVIITLGAGSVSSTGEKILRELAHSNTSGGQA